jgi:outer membrane protein assembly factor BamB
LTSATGAPRARGSVAAWGRGVLATLAVGAGALATFGGVRAAEEPATPAAEPAASQLAKVQRPFRLGFWPLVRALDAQKPLALLDSAGFVVNSGLFIGSFDDRWVGALSFQKGGVQWWYDGGVQLTAPPGSFGSSIALGFRDGKVTKVEALTGKKQWTASLDSFCERPFALVGTTLYAMTAAQVLYALEFQTGKTQWLFDAGFPDGLTIRGGAKPLLFDGKLIAGLASGELVAVDAGTGKLLWRYNPSYSDARFHDVVGELVVRNNRLIVARYDGLVAAIDLTGKQRAVVWQEKLPGLSTSAFRNARYFVGGLNGDVYALDPDNAGKHLWRAVTGAPVVSLTVGESVVYVAGARGRVTALDARTGDLLWTDELGGAIAAPPALTGDGIYFETGMKNIYAYKLN